MNEADPLEAREIRRRDRWSLEGAARVLHRMLSDRPSMRMVRVTFSLPGTVLIYADGERGAELMEAFEVIRKRHADLRADGSLSALPSAGAAGVGEAL